MNTESFTNGASGLRPATAAIISGVALLVMAMISGASNFAVVQGTIVAGDPIATSANIVSRGALLRLGSLAFVVTAMLDIVVAWGLYEVFRRAQPAVSALGAWLRLTYAAVFIIAVGNLFGALNIAPSDPNAAYLLARSFRDIWTLGLLVFGCHLIVVGALAIRASFVHWLFGVLLVLAGVGYVFDSVTALLVPDFGFELALFTFVGEVVFVFWLLIRGPRLH